MVCTMAAMVTTVAKCGTLRGKRLWSHVSLISKDALQGKATFTFLKFLYIELTMGLSGVIRPLIIWDMMLPRVTIPITDLLETKQEFYLIFVW